MTVQSAEAHHTPPPGVSRRRLDRRAAPTLGLAAVFVACWPIVLRSFGGDGVYVTLGLYGILIVAAMSVVGGKLQTWDWSKVRTNALLGLAVGVGMTVATYVAYRASVALFPSLAAHVEGLYAATRATHMGAALMWTGVVVMAEEFLWRGPIFDVVPPGTPRSILVGLSLASYTAVQFGTGSAVVALAAFVCGTIWMAERLLTKSMVAPLISHAIWTMTVIHLLPVTSV